MAKKLLLILCIGSAFHAVSSPTDPNIVLVDNSVVKDNVLKVHTIPVMDVTSYDNFHFIAALDHSVPDVLENPMVHGMEHVFYPEGFIPAVYPMARAPDQRKKPVLFARARDKP